MTTNNTVKIFPKRVIFPSKREKKQWNLQMITLIKEYVD